MRCIHGIVRVANGNPAADRFFRVQDLMVERLVWLKASPRTRMSKSLAR